METHPHPFKTRISTGVRTSFQNQNIPNKIYQCIKQSHEHTYRRPPETLQAGVRHIYNHLKSYQIYRCVKQHIKSFTKSTGVLEHHITSIENCIMCFTCEMNRKAIHKWQSQIAMEMAMAIANHNGNASGNRTRKSQSQWQLQSQSQWQSQSQ